MLWFETHGWRGAIEKDWRLPYLPTACCLTFDDDDAKMPIGWYLCMMGYSQCARLQTRMRIFIYLLIASLDYLHTHTYFILKVDLIPIKNLRVDIPTVPVLLIKLSQFGIFIFFITRSET
jgi:hypothetical protein